ncbi:MAG: lamin tail domain-containing protein [Pseudomonadota bacterium]
MRKISGVALILCLVSCSNGVQDPQDQGSGDGGQAEARGEDVVIPDGGAGELQCQDTCSEDLPDLLVPEVPDVDLDTPSDLTVTDSLDGGGELVDAAEDAGPDGADAEAETDGGVTPPACDLDLDCPPASFCKGGSCLALPECAEDGDCPVDLESCVEGKCLPPGASPYAGTVRINELLSDGTADEDANQDGSVDAMEDEFVELVVVSNSPVDISGWMITEKNWDVWLPRHTFPPGTILSSLAAAVIFGGGDSPESSDAILFGTANAADPGTPYGLDLDDDGDEVRLLDAEGRLVDAITYGQDPQPASDQSLTRSPDLIGPWLPHLEAVGAAGAVFSPGTRVDGALFPD